ncbi:OmcA/MtrC family decaheme c-type cytochrome [Ferrimonas balearica]|uniref:OmcA/MtrC family decaheme c-type cytochrome n=1 Tax=Ferrimonas balearica TaxID=44012 RepID=UPI001C99DD9A|nr:OmcA/MtrC family decaheme c-type cytochrome [Ferrimonas balearica]MBY5920999.1 OmcA/MtrC family decaheme c-type cytochrome [Ferrimonas balearica]MBY5996316.1 OmcA/MtrC family decaheme c-type cytochrome [Ferrimonas balearica]
MTNNKMQWRLTACAAILATTLAGCSDDGKDGNPGDPGRPGGNPAESIAQLNLDVTKVEYVDGQPMVTVLATNEEDKSVVGLQGMEVKNYQLYPQGAFHAGDSARWASAGSSKVYEDHGNGYYTFTFEGIEQNRDLTQRYNVLAGNNTLPDGTPVPRNEISEDFDGNGNDPLYTKDVISHEVCTSCHVEGEPLTTRHSSYFEAETCINCHNEDRMTGKRASFQHLVHTIHNTTATFTDKYGREYTGEAAEHLLQNNCQSCHVASEELAEWGNWTRVPTKETCSACHNDGYNGKDVVYTRHMAEQDNSTCAACHNPTQIETIHTQSHKDQAAVVGQFGVEATSTVAESQVTISVTITQNGQPIDAASIAKSLDMVEYVSNVGPNYPVLGYYGKDSKALHGEEITAAIQGGSVVYTTGALPFGTGDADTALTLVGVRVCAENGVLAECSDTADKIALDAYTSFVSATGASLAERHNSLDNASCLGCHGETFQLHNGSHHAGFVLNDNVKVGDCASCHTPEGTYAPTNLGAIELKLHKVHGEQWIVADCTQCHTNFELGAFDKKGALNVSIQAYENGEPKFDEAGKVAWSFVGYATPRAATCLSCHDGDAGMASNQSMTVRQHMEQHGNAEFGDDRSTISDSAQVESCFYCHKPELTNHKVISF